MLHCAGVSRADHVLVTGASGGVGSATVQLAKRRGAFVTAIADRSKLDAILKLGADRLIARDEDVLDALGEQSVDVVIDNVAGVDAGRMIRMLKRGGRYASSGAIAGPVVTLDMREFYLKDLTFFGCTARDRPVFDNLVGYIERGEIRPLLARTFPLHDIAEAQREFLKKKHVGKFVLIPPAVSDEQRRALGLSGAR